MLKKIILASLVFGSFAMASTTTPLRSYEEYRVGQGDVQTYFNIDSEIIRGDASGEIYDISLGANYFINDMLAPGLLLNIYDSGTTNVRLLPNIKVYYPMNSRILPFVQGGLGYGQQFDQSAFLINLGAGVNYLLSSSVAVGINLNYDLYAGDSVFHSISFPIGFSIYFRL